MHCRIFPALALPALLAIVGLSAPSVAHAQAAVQPTRQLASSAYLHALSRERAARWAEASGPIRCGPAPLVERVDWALAANRPRVVPLEEAFLDAARAKSARGGAR
jgi:hypothetical protein